MDTKGRVHHYCGAHDGQAIARKVNEVLIRTNTKSQKCPLEGKSCACKGCVTYIKTVNEEDNENITEVKTDKNDSINIDSIIAKHAFKEISNISHSKRLPTNRSHSMRLPTVSSVTQVKNVHVYMSLQV